MPAAIARRRRPMPKVIVLYPPPKDANEFERRYRTEHAPMVVGKIPGLKQFVAARIVGAPDGSAGAYQRIAELYFDTNAALQAGLASPECQAAVAHAVEISSGGTPTVLVAEDDPA
jgi:uncharacterized protein (TIGR02118 family)